MATSTIAGVLLTVPLPIVLWILLFRHAGFRAETDYFAYSYPPNWSGPFDLESSATSIPALIAAVCALGCPSLVTQKARKVCILAVTTCVALQAVVTLLGWTLNYRFLVEGLETCCGICFPAWFTFPGLGVVVLMDRLGGRSGFRWI